jgi:hypothetical protein
VIAAVGALIAVAAFAGPPSPVGATAEEFVPGSGLAYAQLFAATPRVAALRVPVTVGTARAGYQGTMASAEAQTFDPGFFGLVLTTEVCGQRGIPPEMLPKPTTVNSARGPASQDREVLGPGGGRESAAAWPGAKGVAESRPLQVDIPGVVALDGTARAEAELIPGRQRRARAVVEVDRLAVAGGALTVRGMRWDVEHRTGERAGTTATFHPGELAFAGRTFAPDSPAAAQVVAQRFNEAFGSLGLRIEVPRVLNDQDGGIEVTPLRLTLGDGPLTSQLAKPLLAALQPAREAVAAALGGSCANDGLATRPLVNVALTVADLVAGIFSGTGGVNLDIGGVGARTEGTTYDNPFDAAPREPVGTVAQERLPTRPLLQGGAAPPGASTTSATTQPNDERTASLVAHRWCRTTSGAAAPACSLGNGRLAVATAGLAVTTLAAADGLRCRRSRRRGQAAT